MISIATSWISSTHVVKFVHDSEINKSPCISCFKKNNLCFSFFFFSSSYQTFNNKIKFHDTKNIDSGPGNGTKKMHNTNGFRTETMYVYYIAMKIYVLDWRNIFSSFFCLCITICFLILLSWTKHKHQPLSKQKPFKIKTSIPFTILF
jgi:hypothetical protein